MSNTALYQCEKCGYSTNNPVAFALHPCRPSNGVNWNSRKPGMSNGQRIIAAFAGVIFAASLLISPAKTQEVQPTPTPTPTTAVGGGPQILDEHHVYLPMISASDNDIVTGTVSWCPSCSPRR